MSANEPLELKAGARLPDLALSSTGGDEVNLSTLSGTTVVYVYPRTGQPDAPPIEGWDQIPGAVGCTPQSCGFRDHYDDLLTAGAAQVFGLSTQDTEYQREVVGRLHLPFSLLSDASFELSRAIGLQSFEAVGMTLLRRVTLVVQDGQIERVFSPVPNPAENAADVVAYLANR